MARLTKGALRVKALLLSGLFLLATGGVSAQNAGSDEVIPIKTLAPLPVTESSDRNAFQSPAPAPATTPARHSLVYTPETTDDNQSEPDENVSTDLTGTSTGEELASDSQGVVEPGASQPVEPEGGELSGSSTDDAETASASNQNDEIKPAEPAEPGDPVPSKLASSPSQNKEVDNKPAEPANISSSDQEIAQAPAVENEITEPVTPADPEVSEPVPLAQAGGTKIEPIYMKKLPRDAGTVQIRRPFKLFATQELIRNLSFRNTPVKEVVAEIARRGKLNVLIDRSATGAITGELHDVTLNEAMDAVLAAAGLESRRVDETSVVVGTMQAMVQLGLNRPKARAFKLSYAHPFDVASLLHASVFNKGYVPDFSIGNRVKHRIQDKDQHRDQRDYRTTTTGSSVAEGGGTKKVKNIDRDVVLDIDLDDDTRIVENNQINRPDVQRTLRGTTRSQVQEGVGFNNAATDPGSMQIRQEQEIPTDYSVEQNNGGAIVIPDPKNRQVIVVGTPDDLVVAEQAIRLIDRRPRQVHIQASLVELSNQALRQLGASLQLQGEGASGTILGQQGAPLVQFLPGLGSPGNSVQGSLYNQSDSAEIAVGTPTPPILFNRDQNYLINYLESLVPRNDVTTAGGAPLIPGLVGAILPALPPAIAQVAPLASAQSGFNFLTLSKKAGGRANIATVPSALNLSIDLALQTNKAKVIANPSVVVGDNTEALITIATEVLHKVTSTVSLGVVNTNVELVKAGIFLDVLPRVTEDGFIEMRLRPTVSTPGIQTTISAGVGAPPIVFTPLTVREVLSQSLRIKDGQTLVIGGLFTEQEQAQLSKVPYLSETPIFGAFFRNTLKARNRQELILLITPKIVEDEPPTSLTEGSGTPTM